LGGGRARRGLGEDGEELDAKSGGGVGGEDRRSLIVSMVTLLLSIPALIGA